MSSSTGTANYSDANNLRAAEKITRETKNPGEDIEHLFGHFRLFGDAVSNFTRSLGFELVGKSDPRDNMFSGNLTNATLYFVNETLIGEPSYDLFLGANRSVVMLVAGMCLARFGEHFNKSGRKNFQSVYLSGCLNTFFDFDRLVDCRFSCESISARAG